MYSNFNFHSAKDGSSSSKIFQYLEKENTGRILSNQQKILEGEVIEEDKEGVEYFFNQDMNPYDLQDENSRVNVYDAISAIDNNRGTKSLTDSNFYMLNLSPEFKEQKHIENLAIEELKSRGLVYDDIKDNPDLLTFYNEQKDNLIKLQLKLYTAECMKEYARLMDREIYANQDALPSNLERRKLKPIIEERYTSFLKEKGLPLGDFEKQYVDIPNYRLKQDYPHGKLYSFYSEDIQKNISLFIPNSLHKIDNEVLKIEEQYYADKYNAILDKEEEKRKIVVIEGTPLNSQDNFTDYIKEEKICIKVHYDEFDKDLKLYFSIKDVEIKNGACHIPESIYNKGLYEAKSQFLGKEFESERKEFLEKALLNKGFNIEKIKNENGEEIYKNPEKVPTKEEFKKLNIEASVKFNNFLVDKGYLPKQESFKISDWNSLTVINAKIRAESEKARLLEIIDDRLSEPKQMWVGNFAIKDISETGEISILSEFYENKIREFELKENETKLVFDQYDEVENYKESYVKNSDSVEFTFDNTGLKKPLKFNIKHEDLFLSVDGKYTIENDIFKHKYEKHLLDQAKKEFSKEFEAIKKEVNAEMLESKEFVKDKEIEKRFKNFLVDKGILQEDSKDEKYLLTASVVETKNNSSLIAVKQDDKEEDVRFWVNTDLITGKEENGLLFRNEKEIDNLLDKALERDKERKEIVEIKFDSKEIETKEVKNEQGEPEKKNTYVFYKSENGLEDPIKFKISESELTEKEGKFFIEKYKLDHKEKNAIKYGISKQYGNVKDDIKNEVWKENGFDTEKRKVTDKDLLYFGKVETERTYKHTSKDVLFNRPILKQIDELRKLPQSNGTDKKIGKLSDKLMRDKYTNEVIKEGVKKGGLNYHVHVVISRHDKTSLNSDDKVSMSPLSNQKNAIMFDGSKVGFERNQFYENVETLFDRSFQYDRKIEEHYKYRNEISKSGQMASSLAISKIKQEIKEKLGLSELTNHSAVGINIPTSLPTSMKDVVNIVNVNNIKRQISELPIPTSLPTSKIDAVIKAIKLLKNLVVDKGMQI
ncbi:DUF5712 family protein [Elizabethkingia anophelis]|uniref:DUF5712 family protein n=1 Tax=Elizabethkingia anophelis TaxID=1117645 RepID=UPI000550C557|nr:DUF5712 family protein [Elizabethkingia anophelis]MCS7369697.1 DUF5712 family protein [Elizabethkingia anophelis]MCS7374973.1 DUF5712 family protein [Elizabethkingia anophelis]MCS7387329.1 DUF5712 family protein [Elizabethkingia anophelis]